MVNQENAEISEVNRDDSRHEMINKERRIRLQFIFTIMRKDIHSRTKSGFDAIKNFRREAASKVQMERLATILGTIIKSKVNQQLSSSLNILRTQL